MLRFHIANMSCGGCVAGVTRAVAGVSAGATLEADLPSRTVTVGGAPDAEAVLAAIRRAGFQAVPLAPGESSAH